MRTEAEIVERLSTQEDVLLSYANDVLLPFLPFAAARRFLKADATEKEWGTIHRQLDDATVLADACAYMTNYGWPKARAHRGLSASRTVEKMEYWLWLLNTEQTEALLWRITTREIPYMNYGAPILGAICREFGWPIPDDPVLDAMMRSARCPECAAHLQEGCAA